MRLVFLFFFALITSSILNAQEIDYAKRIVKILASEEFKGRGYVSNGDKKAANYIAEEFKNIGLKPFTDSYFQTFDMSVNTFPSDMHVTINNKELVPGKDYLVTANSPSIKGTFEASAIPVSHFFSEELLVESAKKAVGKFVVILPYKAKDYSKEEQNIITEYINFFKDDPEKLFKGTVILTHEKLTWGGATSVRENPVLIVKSEAVESISNLTLNIKNEFKEHYQSQNVIGYIEGRQKSKYLVFTAHYDHLGMMGNKAMFPGANDNASGIAMLLNLAKYYSANTPEYSMVFIAFGAEELGLIGSQYFVENPLFSLSKIKFLINFDLSGTGDDGIQVVNGKLYKKEFEKLVSLNQEHKLLKQVKIRGEACNSDHCLFHMKKVPCFYIYTLGGIKAYHDIYDKAETLPLTKFEDYFKLLTHFINSL